MKHKRVDDNVVELDVREMLRNNEEPFGVIMEAVNSLKTNDRLVLHATFEPIPLLRVMKKKGFNNKVEHVEKSHWIVTFYRDKEE